MSFRYVLRDPNGQTYIAATRDEADAILDRLQTEFPDGEIEIEADVAAPNTRTPASEPEDILKS